MNYYSGHKKEWSSHTCSNVAELKNIMPDESQTQKVTLYNCLYLEYPKEIKTAETRSKLVVARDWGNGYRPLFGGKKNISELDRSGGCVTLWIYYRSLNWALYNGYFMLSEFQLREREINALRIRPTFCGLSGSLHFILPILKGLPFFIPCWWNIFFFNKAGLISPNAGRTIYLGYIWINTGRHAEQWLQFSY